jgi:hypothetical protein
VEITSGGTPGPRLAEALRDLDSNVFGELPALASAHRVAEALATTGWSARASSYTDYEVEREWASIELQPWPGGVLFSGVVDPSRVDELAAIFEGLGLRYSIELYNPDRSTLLRHLRG